MDAWGWVLVFDGDGAAAAVLASILEANGIATTVKGPGLYKEAGVYVRRADEAEARRLITAAESSDPPVDRDVAEEVVYRLSELQQTLSRPLVVPFGEEFPRLAEWQRIVGDATGVIYTDLMMPFIEQYPDLDPDRGGLQPPADRPAGPGEPVDEARFARALRDAAVDVLRELDAISRFVESREGTRAQLRFDADGDRSRQALRHLLQTAKDALRA